MKIVPDMIISDHQYEELENGRIGYLFENIKDGEEFKFIHRPTEVFKMIRTGDSSELNCSKCFLKLKQGSKINLCNMSNCKNLIGGAAIGYNGLEDLEPDYTKLVKLDKENKRVENHEDEDCKCLPKYAIKRETECKSGYIVFERIVPDEIEPKFFEEGIEPAHGEFFLYGNEINYYPSTVVAVKTNSFDNYQEENEDSCMVKNCYLARINAEKILKEDKTQKIDEDSCVCCTEEEESEHYERCTQQSRDKHDYHVTYLKVEV